MYQHFIEEDTQMASNHMKRWIALLAIREVQTATAMIYDYTTHLSEWLK